MAQLGQGEVLVTGTSSGIGKELALHLDRLGFTVHAAVRRDKDAAALAAESTTGRLKPLILDVADSSSIEAAAKKLEGVALVGLVNNAGITYGGVLESFSREKMRQLFEVNVFGSMETTQRFLPHLRAGKGRIVNISSPGAVVVTPF